MPIRPSQRHADARTTKLYDRQDNKGTGKIVERISIENKHQPPSLPLACSPRTGYSSAARTASVSRPRSLRKGVSHLKPELTIPALCSEAGRFADLESSHKEPSIYGVDNGKTIGTYFEHKFQDHLSTRYTFKRGSSAKGRDWPELDVDMKFTSIKQPQSSCPYKSARQKIYGLGYPLLLFVYDKTDDRTTLTGTLNILHAVFIEMHRTADFQTTTGIRQILQNDGNTEDLIGFMRDRNLPVDDIQANQIAEELLQQPPEQGYLTISNALQWRLQYARVIEQAGRVEGLLRLK